MVTLTGRQTKNSTLERTFENRVGSILSKLDIYNFHVEDKMGLPDRYVAGGNWIEFKRTIWNKRGILHIMPLLRPAQRNRLNMLTRGGDRCWVAVNIYAEMHNHVIIKPWVWWTENTSVDFKTVRQEADIKRGAARKNNLAKYVSSIFNPRFERYSNFPSDMPVDL